MILPVGRDHVRGAIGVLRLDREHRVVFLGDLLIGIRGHREFVAALAHRKLVERVDGIVRNADDGRAQGLELVGGLGEFVRLDGAAGRERRRIEIQHHRTVLERIGQGKGERLAGERRLGGEVRRLAPGFNAAYSGAAITQAPRTRAIERFMVRTPWEQRIRWEVAVCASPEAAPPQAALVRSGPERLSAARPQRSTRLISRTRAPHPRRAWPETAAT